MKFVINSRGFILPLLGGVTLLFQNWIPNALTLCVIINIAGLILLAMDYFTLPEPELFKLERLLPPQLFIQTESEIVLRITYDILIPLSIQCIDRPPTLFDASPEIFSLTLNRGIGEFELRYPATPLKRGKHAFGNPALRITSPLGLISKQLTLSQSDEITVYPQLQTEKEGLQSQFYMAQSENRQLKTYGPGREFSQMREYVYGDDVKNIHWKSSARSNRLVVKEHEPEKGQNIFVMIDGGRLMMAETAGLSKVDWAVASTIALAREALIKKDSIGVMGFSNKVETFLMPANKNVQLSTLVNTIYDFQPDFIEPDYKSSFEWVHANLKNRSIIVLYTDFIDPYLSSELATHIKILKKKHRIICCAMGFENLNKIGHKLQPDLKEALFSATVRESITNRELVLQELRNAGVEIVDVYPEKLCAEVLNRYIKVRWR